MTPLGLQALPAIAVVLLVWATEWARLTWHRDQTGFHAFVHAASLVGLTGLACFHVWHVWPMLVGSLTLGGLIATWDARDTPWWAGRLWHAFSWVSSTPIHLVALWAVAPLWPVTWPPAPVLWAWPAAGTVPLYVWIELRPLSRWGRSRWDPRRYLV